MRAWALEALDLVYPALCPVCDARLGEHRRDPLCGACWAAIERFVPPLCAICGRPLLALDPDAPTGSDWCGACLVAPPPYDWARAAAHYAGPVREAIQALKFAGRRALARPLATLILEAPGTPQPLPADVLVPVPLGLGREGERGFNQAMLLAEPLARAWRLPLRPRWLARVRATRPQSELSATERRANVRGAFVAAPAVVGQRVVLLDDVLTTGATVGECARTLRAAGARAVGVLAVARA